MSARKDWVTALVMVVLCGSKAWSQPAGFPQKPATPPPSPTAVAALVNGQPIPEVAVYRALGQEKPPDAEEARRDVLSFLIGNVLIDQYLMQQKIPTDPKEIDQRMAQMRAEAKKEKKDFDEILKALFITEQELRYQITCALRWEKFAGDRATDQALRGLFDSHRAIFDGSQVLARHILIKGSSEKERAGAAELKRQIEAEAARELAKLPPTTSKLDQESNRMKTLEAAFVQSASKVSDCPSRADGGYLGWFARAGAMVEPFAKVAFATPPYQISEPVPTEFGYHLILVLKQKPGREVKFEDLRPVVREVYFERLREALIVQLRPRARIVINPPGKN